LNSTVDEATEAMKKLEDATNQLVEDAKVSEAMMQYANRYKTDPVINQTMNQAIELWENNFDYGAARGMITSALEAKEPGVAGRIAASYEQEEEI
jgi:septation ring formation regulator